MVLVTWSKTNGMPRRLRLFPLNAVLFPGALLNLHIFETRYKQMINECLQSGEGFGVALIAEGAEAGDPNVTPHDVGSIAEIVDVQPLPLGRCFISTIGRQRFKIKKIVSREPYLTVEAEIINEEGGAEDDEVERLTGHVRELFAEYVALVVEFSGEKATVELPTDARDASFAVGDGLQIAELVKQRLLELDSTKKRLLAEENFLEQLLPQLRRLLERRRSQPLIERYFGRSFSAN
jgi:uncharacterized protein